MAVAKIPTRAVRLLFQQTTFNLEGNIMNAKQLMIGLGFSMMAAASAPALAADAKTLPGAACQPAVQTTTNLSSLIILNDGSLINAGTASITVICPIMRDVMAANGSAGINSAQVYVVDNNNNTNDPRVSCTLESRTTGLGSANPGLVESLTVNSTAGASPNIQVIQFGNFASAENGYYHFRCNIPGIQMVGGSTNFSKIVMYRVTEND
jgi:hypothetical protein